MFCFTGQVVHNQTHFPEKLWCFCHLGWSTTYHKYRPKCSCHFRWA